MGTKRKTESVGGADPAERVAEFYSRKFGASSAGRMLLEKRGITQAELYSRHRFGYSDGSLLKSLPSQGALPTLLAERGILIKVPGGRFSERFLKCTVIPGIGVTPIFLVYILSFCVLSGSGSHLRFSFYFNS